MNTPTDEQYRKAARDYWASDDLEIDDSAEVKPVAGAGAWVQAWIYINAEEASE